MFADIVNNGIQITRFKGEEKGILLTCQVDPGINPMLLGDTFRLNQVLVNLLGNAIKFTEHGEVKLEIKKLTEDDETVRAVIPLLSGRYRSRKMMEKD